jgi:hypothetical protein
MISASVLYNHDEHPLESMSGSGVIPTGSIYYNVIDSEAYVYNGSQYKPIFGVIGSDFNEQKIDLNDTNAVSGSVICEVNVNRMREGESINFDVLGGLLNNTGTSRTYTYVLKLKDSTGEFITRIEDPNAILNHSSATRAHLDLKWTISFGNSVTYISGMVERTSTTTTNTPSNVITHSHIWNFDAYMYTSSFTASLHIATSATGTIQNLSRWFYKITKC